MIKTALWSTCSFLLFSLSISSARAQDTTAQCIEKYEIFDDNTQVQVQASGSNCYVSVHPRSAFEDMIYRDYMFNSNGQLMIFDSYGDGPEASTTAAREFYFFPRKNAVPTYAYDATAKTLSVTTVSGKVVVFNTVKAVITSISGSQISQNFTVKPENKGGLEITQNDGLFLDGGFKRGQAPSQNPKNVVTFKDAQNNSCDLRNGDIYRYTSDDDAIFKYNDAQLKTQLKSRCPQLQF